MYVTERDITTAYLHSLNEALNNFPSFALVTRVTQPVLSIDVNADKKLSLEGLNLNPEMHKVFEEFNFGKHDGKWWIQDRVRELFSGSYRHRLETQGNLEKAIDALKGFHSGEWQTWSTNTIVCTLFNTTEDLHKNRTPSSPCLLYVDFKRQKSDLHIIASWRAQFFDTKLYGNLISLTMLLRRTCLQTGFQAGNIISVANKAIFKKNRKVGRQLVKEMESVLYKI